MVSDVVVIGAGISGLAAAHALDRAGLAVQVLERSQRPGGRVLSERFDGFLMEHGPNCVVAPAPELEQLSAALGIAAARIERGGHVRNRYLVRDGRARRLPISPLGFALCGYLPAAALLRMTLEPFVRRVPDDESVAAFVERRFGRELLEAVVDPLIGGLHAGDPARLSVAAVLPLLKRLEARHGSVLGGILRARLARGRSEPHHPANRRLFSFRDGLGTVPGALAAQLGDRIRYGVRVEAIRPLVSGGFALRVSDAGGRRVLQARGVLLAVPASVGAALLGPLDAAIAGGLGALEHPPLAVVYLGYPRRGIAHPLDGLGVLAPSRERRDVLGMLFSSTLFAGRAPAEHVAITAYVGGARSPGLAGLPDEALVELVHAEARTLLGATAAPVVSRIRRWRHGLPQPAPGHGALVASLAQLEEELPGLGVTGNFVGGVSVANCVSSALASAARLTRRLASAQATGMTRNAA